MLQSLSVHLELDTVQLLPQLLHACQDYTQEPIPPPGVKL